MKITEVNLRQLKHSTLFPNRTFAHCPPQLQPNTLQPPPNTITTTLFPLNQIGTLTLACTLPAFIPNPNPFNPYPPYSLLQLPWSPSVIVPLWNLHPQWYPSLPIPFSVLKLPPLHRPITLHPKHFSCLKSTSALTSVCFKILWEQHSSTFSLKCLTTSKLHAISCFQKHSSLLTCYFG